MFIECVLYLVYEYFQFINDQKSKNEIKKLLKSVQDKTKFLENEHFQKIKMKSLTGPYFTMAGGG